MIERGEILRDSASAVYGADAVAGVVNIITRRDFQGVEVTGQFADWQDSEGWQYCGGVVAGTEFAGGDFVQLHLSGRLRKPADRALSYRLLPDRFLTDPGKPPDLPDPGLVPDRDPASGPYQVGTMIPHDGRKFCRD